MSSEVSKEKELSREKKEIQLVEIDPRLIEILLSKERTLLSRQQVTISTAQLALGLAALGLVIVRFFADVNFQWFLVVGWGLVAIAAYLFYHAYKTYQHLQRKLRRLHDTRGHLDKLYGLKPHA